MPNPGALLYLILRIPVPDERFNVPAIVRCIDQHEIECRVIQAQQRIQTGLKTAGGGPAANGDGHERTSTPERVAASASSVVASEHPERATALNRALSERQRAAPDVLPKELTDQAGTVETALSHPADTPAEGTALQPEEDKRGRAIRNG